MKIVKLLQNVIRYSGKTPQQIWKFKYFLMEGKLPLVANIWISDCLQHII